MNAGANLEVASSQPSVACDGSRRQSAVELIRTETGCGEDEATDALCVWTKDGRVAARGLNIHFRAALGIANWLHPGPSLRSVALELYEFGLDALRELLARPDSLRAGRSSQTSTRRAGRRPIYDWSRVETALEQKCRSRAGVPHAEHSDRKWRTLADACQFVRSQFDTKWPNGGPAKSVLKQNVGSMLERIEWRMAGN